MRVGAAVTSLSAKPAPKPEPRTTSVQPLLLRVGEIDEMKGVWLMTNPKAPVPPRTPVVSTPSTVRPTVAVTSNGGAGGAPGAGGGAGRGGLCGAGGRGG